MVTAQRGKERVSEILDVCGCGTGKYEDTRRCDDRVIRNEGAPAHCTWCSVHVFVTTITDSHRPSPFSCARAR